MGTEQNGAGGDANKCAPMNRATYSRNGHLVGAERERLAAGFGARLVEARTAAGLSARGLASATGMHWSSVCRLELGERRPRLSTVRTLARALEPACAGCADRLASELVTLAAGSLRDGAPERSRKRRRDRAVRARVAAHTEQVPPWVLVPRLAPCVRCAAAEGDSGQPAEWPDVTTPDQDSGPMGEWAVPGLPPMPPGDYPGAPTRGRRQVSQSGTPDVGRMSHLPRRSRGPLALVTDSPRPQQFTREMFDAWSRKQLLSMLRPMPFPAQIAAVARAYECGEEEAEDRLWALHAGTEAASDGLL